MSFSKHNTLKLILFATISIIAVWSLGKFLPDFGFFDTLFADSTGQNIFKESIPQQNGSGGFWDTGWDNWLDILLTLLLASFLSAMVSYRRRGGKNQMDFTEAHIVLASSAALMMMIIGSQLARAFGLMGAASIIRYRYSLKSPREASSLVIALGIGMACGVGLNALAVIVAVYITIVVNFFEFMPGSLREFLFLSGGTWSLRIRTKSPAKALENLEEYLDKQNLEYRICGMEEGKGQDKNLSDITCEITGNFDKNDLTLAVKDDDTDSIRWKKTGKTDA